MKTYLILTTQLLAFSLIAQEGKGKLEVSDVPVPAPVFTSDLSENSKRTHSIEASTLSADDRIVNFPDFEARFPGGQDAANSWLMEQIIREESKADLTGKVLVEFIVEKDGTLSNLSAKNEGDKHAEKTAIKIVSDMPLWQPAGDGGEAVRSKGRVLINFDLIGE